MRRGFSSWLLLLAGSIALSACGAAAQPASAPAASASSWDELTAAAKREGTLQLMGPQGTADKQALTDGFQKKFGVSVDYLGVGGPEAPPRVQREREGGQYQWDVFIVGTTTLLRGLKPLGALDPIEPALVLPEVTDPKNWAGGQLPLSGKDHMGIGIARIAGQPVYANKKQVDTTQFHSWRDLLDPKWKGKILLARDPQLSGYAQAMFLFFYTSPQLGPDFIRALAGQDLKILRDDRTGAQWLGEGKYALCVCADIDTSPLIKEGLVDVVDPHQLKEGHSQTTSNGNVALANRAPHPNAAKVYINWVLSREGAELWSRASGHASTRADVPIDNVPPWSVPDPTWFRADSEDALDIQANKLGPFLKEVLGSY